MDKFKLTVDGRLYAQASLTLKIVPGLTEQNKNL